MKGTFVLKNMSLASHFCSYEFVVFCVFRGFRVFPCCFVFLPVPF